MARFTCQPCVDDWWTIALRFMSCILGMEPSSIVKKRSKVIEKMPTSTVGISTTQS